MYDGVRKSGIQARRVAARTRLLRALPVQPPPRLAHAAARSRAYVPPVGHRTRAASSRAAGVYCTSMTREHTSIRK